MSKRYGKAVCALIVVLMVGAGLLWSLIRPPWRSYQEFYGLLEKGEVHAVTFTTDHHLQYTTAGGETFLTDAPGSEGFREELLLAGVKVNAGGLPPVTTLLVTLAASLGIVWF